MNTVHVEAFDLNLLLAFDALWTERHVTRAARRIGVTQSAMSHALRRLRAQLEDPLFQTTPHGLSPTARAHAIAPSIAEALALVRRAVEEVGRFTPKTLRRTFTIATTDYGELALLPRLFARLSREAPEVQLVVRPEIDKGERELLSGEHDLVLGVGVPEGTGLRGEELFNDGFVCLLRAGHPMARRPLTLSRFLELRHVLVSPQGRGESAVDAALRARKLSRRLVLRVPHFLAAPLVIAESDAIITLPEHVARAVAAQHGLVIKKPPLPLPRFSFSQFWHTRNDGDAAHQWLRELVYAVARSAPSARAA
jgi:LysR family transcriptional regulator, transcriptional activator of nodD3 and syrA